MSSLSSNEHKVMFEKLRDVASVQEEAILHMADEIVPAFGGDECVWNSLCHPTNVSEATAPPVLVSWVTSFVQL